MENMITKYASVLRLIKDEPDFNRIRAIRRFLMLMNFEDNFMPSWGKGGASRAKGVTVYCKRIHESERNFYRYLGIYKKQGIVGLLTKFGKGGDPSTKVDRHIFTAKIHIDVRAPLRCIKSFQNIIKQCWLIKPEIKKASLSILSRYFNGLIVGGPLTLSTPLTDDEIKVLLRYKASTHRNHCNKAIAILMADEGKTLLEIMETTHAAARTIYHWLSNFNRYRLESIKVHVHSPERDRIKSERQTKVIDIIHKLPSLYGINKTSWTYGAIATAYEKEYGVPINYQQIHTIIKKTGYQWRRARIVLTSPDPEYKLKIQRILITLKKLKEGDCFFFIDEVGPYRVKKYGGRRLTLQDQVETIPGNQKGRGKIQFIAALEAVTNQLTWRFTEDKSSFSMTSFLGDLVASYKLENTLYFTWDDMSVHNSKVVMNWIEAHNMLVGVPRIEVVPLPSRSQFLNVIEAVFGGMKKAIICNSDYPTPKDMQDAISLYFEERNRFFKENPKRAGNKIWDMEAFDIDKLEGGLFKKM